MKIIAINGSPRNRWNSDTALENAVKGAQSQGAEVEKYNLFDLNFSGCRSCFACKLKDGSSFAKCACKDDLSKVLDDILASDGLIISSPVYFGEVPGTVRSLYERLCFPCLLYSASGELGYKKRIPTVLIYTMGAEKPEANGNLVERDKGLFETFIGPTDTLNITNTYQYSDYSKYVGDYDIAGKTAQRENGFPEDLKKAYALGQNLAR